MVVGVTLVNVVTGYERSVFEALKTISGLGNFITFLGSMIFWLFWRSKTFRCSAKRLMKYEPWKALLLPARSLVQNFKTRKSRVLTLL